ncbi:hypothetical protein N566_24460 [Streptomycetaceae bacterium MP113-05]|nr:hypothetical protein N566_24460 [Streptomycetaceae bacterium MP113-05]
MSGHAPYSPHTDVGAYALGLLTGAEAAHFEEHLAACPRCADELEADLALRPLLEDAGAPDDGPGVDLLGRVLAAVGSDRLRSRRRRRALAGGAVAAVLAAGTLGGVATGILTGGAQAPAAPTEAEAVHAAFARGEKFSDHDPATRVEATVSLQERPWGTHVTLRIGNLAGPRACDLVAVGADGRRQTVTSWSVPGYGYGIEGTAYDEPLYVAGGAALTPDRIDHFEIRSLTGEKLAAIPM